MNPDTVVLDISSDEEGEEVSWGGSRGNCDGDDHNWLTELLDEVDRETDDSDDVVVVSEVFVNPKQRLKTASLKGLADDDDECMILDGDPDEPVAVRKDCNDDDAGGDSDELVVVSEKGQVACRDYPHPRHLCVQFPFSSTPHERHCDQCHCYVCDSLAPCVHWGAGSLTVDHCHATEKDELWRLQRKSRRTGDKVFLPACKATDASITMRLPQMNEISLLPPPLQPLEWANDSDLGPTSLRACSMSTNFPGPNPVSQSRSLRHGYSLPTNRFQHNLVSQHLASTCNSTNLRDKRHNSASGYLGLQFARNTFKRTSTAGSASYSSSRVPHGSHGSRGPPSVVTTSNSNPIRSQEFHGGVVSSSDMYMGPSKPLMGNIFDSAPSHGPRHFRSELPPHPTADTPSDNPVPSTPELSPHPNGETTSAYSAPPESQLSTRRTHSLPSQLQMSPLTNFTIPPEPQVSPQSNYLVPVTPPTYHVPFPPPTYHMPLPPPTYHLPLSSPTYPVPPQPQLATQPNYVTPSQAQISSLSSIPTPSEPQINNQSVPVSNYCPNITEDTDFQDFDFNWTSPPRENGQQSSTKNLPAEGVAPIREVPLVGDPGLGDDFQYDSWIFDNQPVEPGSFDVAATSSGLNGFSPEPGLTDAGEKVFNGSSQTGKKLNDKMAMILGSVRSDCRLDCHEL